MTPTLEDRLDAYRNVLDDAIELRLGEPDPGPAGRQWRILLPVLGGAAVGVIMLVVALSGRDAAGPAPAATPPSAGSIPAEPRATEPLSAPTTVPTTVATPSPSPPPPPPTATAVPPAPVGLTMAIGDEVMLGAADELAAAGVFVDAEVSRQMRTMIGNVERLAGMAPAVVVVHLGNSGTLNDETIDEFFGALRGVPHVVVLTDRAPRPYIAANNVKFLALPERYANVTVVDWERLADVCPGECFYDDGIHLRQDGQTYYARIILDALGQ